jgi:ATP-dependent exoDNAse (exonuclease V) beta subunit
MSKNFQAYKSSAGSGKTFTLTKFFLSIVLSKSDPTYFKKVLAITFTVKAAAEMKERIIFFLSQFSNSHFSEPGVNTMANLLSKECKLSTEQIGQKSKVILSHLLQNYGDLSVLTIDKFIHRIVRSFASDLGYQPDFEIEINGAQLADQVIDGIMSDVGIDDHLSKLLIEYSLGQSLEDKAWDITSVLLSLTRELNSEEYFLSFDQKKKLNMADVPEISAWLREQIRNTEQLLSDLGKRATDLISDSGLESTDFYQGKKGIASYFEKCADGNMEYAINPNSYVHKSINEEVWQSGGKHPMVLEIQSDLESIASEILGLNGDLLKAIFYSKLTSQLYSVALIGEIQTRLTSIKTEHNKQLLSDFYRSISEKLGDELSPFIYERLGNRYVHILIDEFQDTSILQWSSLQPLVINALAEGNSTLVVGDAKQSIYRFRGSDPFQFVELPSGGTPNLLLESEYEEHILSQNYRSSEAVVSFNNQFFAELSARFLPSQFASIYSNLAQEVTRDVEGCVEFIGVETMAGVSASETIFNKMETSISNLIKTKKSGLDLCVLFQKNKDAANFAGHMIGLGYDITSDESLLLSSSPRVQLVMDTLRAMQRPNDVFHTQKVISRLYQNGLIKGDYHKFANTSKQDRLNFKQALQKLGYDPRKLREHANAFEGIADLSAFYNFPITDSYLRKLLDFALLYHENGGYLDEPFLDRWDKESGTLSIDSSANTGSIKVMTIHKSKGLEFKNVMVYLPELKVGRTTKDYAHLDDLQIPMLDSAIVPFNILKNSPFEQILENEQDNSTLDLCNQVYVAFTRAAENLSIFSNFKKGHLQSEPIRFIENWDEWNSESQMLTLRS